MSVAAPIERLSATIHGPEIAWSKQHGSHHQYILSVSSHSKPRPPEQIAALRKLIEDCPASSILGVQPHQAGVSVKVLTDKETLPHRMKRLLRSLSEIWEVNDFQAKLA